MLIQGSRFVSIFPDVGNNFPINFWLRKPQVLRIVKSIRI